MSGYTRNGWGRVYPAAVYEMVQPVQCRCGGFYDLGKVEVTARYSDCSVWKAPCCRATVDDRGETGWKSFSDYTRIEIDRSAFDVE